jgi:O-antigen ligase
MNRSDRVGRWLEGAVLFGLYAVPLTVAWTVAGVHLAVGLAAAAALVLGLLRRRWLVRRTPADWAMLAFAAAGVISTLFSPDRAQSFIGLKKLLLLPLVHIAAAALATPSRARTALRLFVAGIAATSLVALVHFLATPQVEGARLRSTGHYMTFAGLLLLAWPLAADGAAMTRGRVRGVYLALLPLFAAALLFGMTRGAWIGSAAAAAALLLRSRPRLALLVPAAAALALLLAPTGVRQRALSSFDPDHPNNIDRVRLWRTGIAIWRAHPWTGVGLVDVRPYVLRYRSSTAGQAHGHLHDNWIQVLATLGALGLLAFAWLMVEFGRSAWRAGLTAGPPELRGLALGIWGAFVGFQLMGLFEWNFGDVEVTIALYFLLGVGLAAASAGSPAPAGGSGARTRRGMSA